MEHETSDSATSSLRRLLRDHRFDVRELRLRPMELVERCFEHAADANFFPSGSRANLADCHAEICLGRRKGSFGGLQLRGDHVESHAQYRRPPPRPPPPP